MQPFDYVVPDGYAQASALLADGAARPLLGGTDLIIRARSGAIRPTCVVDLKRLPGMHEIAAGADGSLTIGAGCTMNAVARHPDVVARYRLLAEACNSVASYQLRNRATIGGNCCNASPAADTAPALFCLDARAHLFGLQGERRVPMADFFVGPGLTCLRPGEFLAAILLPPSPPGACGRFEKLGRTRLGDLSIASVAAYAWPASGGSRWRLALGAVGPTPLRAPAAEDALAADLSPAGIRLAAGLAARDARPIDDLRASAAYRRAMVEVLARRGIEAVLVELLAAGMPGGAA